MIRFPQLIVLGECFFFLHIEKTCLKAYSCTVIYPDSPCKYVCIFFCFVISCLWKALFFLHCIIYGMIFFLKVFYFVLKNYLKVGIILSSIKLKIFAIIYWIQIWRFPQHMTLYCLGSWYAPLSWFLAQQKRLHCSFFCVLNIFGNYLETPSVWNRKNAFFK